MKDIPEYRVTVPNSRLEEEIQLPSSSQGCKIKRLIGVTGHQSAQVAMWLGNQSVSRISSRSESRGTLFEQIIRMISCMT